jgi:cytochrome c553
MIRERFICNNTIVVVIAALWLIAGAAIAAEPAASGVTMAEPAAIDAPVPVLASTTKQPATYVGEKVCTGCHDAENKSFGHTLHAKTFRENPSNETEKTVCEACHGPGSLEWTHQSRQECS